jgi:SPP1 gp7 family putative phage head morphogenesis protein
VTDDAFGLKKGQNNLPFNATKQYAFLSNPQKTVEFKRWLKQQVDAGLLGVDKGFENKPWLSPHIESAFRKGMVRAYVDTYKPAINKPLDFYKGSLNQFLTDSFSAPEIREKVQMLYTRAFEGMQGITAQMSSQLSTILGDGLANGENPNAIARKIRDSIGAIDIKRARVIARTEIIRAHAEGQLSSFERLGVKDLGVLAEWSTAGDDKVCEYCSGNEGKTFTVEEARGLIPWHPSCRCCWIPSSKDFKKIEKGRFGKSRFNK